MLVILPFETPTARAYSYK